MTGISRLTGTCRRANSMSSMGLGFDYVPAAPEPTLWLNFLKQIFEGEDCEQQIKVLQEMFGYMGGRHKAKGGGTAQKRYSRDFRAAHRAHFVKDGLFSNEAVKPTWRLRQLVPAGTGTPLRARGISAILRGRSVIET